MQLILKNVGIIESADIQLNGLTVIAGNNDTGKSTIGKIAFSLTKAYENFEIDSEKEKNRIIRSGFREAYMLTRSSTSFLGKPTLRKFFDSILHGDGEVPINIPKIIEDGKNIINSEVANIETKTRIIDLFNRLELIYKKEMAKIEKIVHALSEILDSEFKSQIKNLESENAEIEVYDGENKIIRVIIKANDTRVELEDKIFPFESSTFIETPFVLQYKDVFEIEDTYHIEDLLAKLSNSAIYNEKEESFISNIIKGKFYFNEKEEVFEFKKRINEKWVTLNLQNVASGIKNFGLLQLLEKSGEFDKNNLLVIDEPEVHLHPDWQVEYAKVLISLIKRGVRILITSHSPYLIEALNKYSEKEELGSKTNFYLAEKQQNGKTIILDKTEEKDIIFERLSKPFERLIFE